MIRACIIEIHAHIHCVVCDQSHTTSNNKSSRSRMVMHDDEEDTLAKRCSSRGLVKYTINSNKNKREEETYMMMRNDTSD